MQIAIFKQSWVCGELTVHVLTEISKQCVYTSHTVCNHGDVRLADGPNKTEGRVELCLDEEWLTVCDYGFSSNEAQTICWQLGFIGR